jgi:DEAD/DEAH box helicase domain-containing protein
MTRLPDALADHRSYHGWLSAQEGYRNQIGFFSYLPGRAQGERVSYGGRYSGILAQLGIVPYRHQAVALSATEAGENIVIATPTASGKSLGYQVPTLDAVARGKHALYLFPTKALAFDQLEKLSALATKGGLAGFISTFDGDTPAHHRQHVREGARCVLTNPDMLHYGVLPHHARWARFLGGLELIVLDELHAYRGVMGTHVANIVRRLLRLAHHYGASPQVVAASATIGNPAEHARNLTGLDFTAITEDEGPRAERELLFWRPPDLPGEAGREGRRRSVHSEAADLAALFVKTGLKSIFFCNSRKSAELLRRYAAGILSDSEKERLASYRAGYSSEDRREIEAGFKQGRISVLTATSALELGVDIGSVDAVVLVGYPGSLTAFWQRAGRAGRSGTRALTLLIPGSDPLDEFYLTHPEAVTEGRVEHAVADAFNSELHPRHLACAVFEKPLQSCEPLVGGTDLGALDGFVQHRGRWFYRGGYPHGKLSVRGTGGKRVILRDNLGRTLGESDLTNALRELHPGAVYLHQGENYLVRNLDLERGEAFLLPHLEDTYTQVRSETDITVLEQGESFGRVRIGRVQVTTSFTSYVRKRLYSEAVLDERLLELPDVSYPTQALWFEVSEVAGSVHPSLLPAAMHALEHTLIGLLPAFVLCERADVGGVSYPIYPASGAPVIFIYDGYPGGVGYAREGAAQFAEWLEAARDLLVRCPCAGGCPRCVLSPKCGNGNQVLDKGAALALAEALLERLEAVPTAAILRA